MVTLLVRLLGANMSFIKNVCFSGLYIIRPVLLIEAISLIMVEREEEKELINKRNDFYDLNKRVN